MLEQFPAPRSTVRAWGSEVAAALSTARRIGSFDCSSSQSMLWHARSKSVWVDSGSLQPPAEQRNPLPGVLQRMDPLRTRFAAGVLCRLIEDGCKTSVLCFLNLTVSRSPRQNRPPAPLSGILLEIGSVGAPSQTGMPGIAQGRKMGGRKKTGGLALCVGGIRQLNSSAARPNRSYFCRNAIRMR